MPDINGNLSPEEWHEREMRVLGGPGSGPQGSGSRNAHAKAADAHEKAAKLNAIAAKPSMGHGPDKTGERSDKAMAASKAAEDATNSVPGVSDHIATRANDAKSYAEHGAHDDAAKEHSRVAGLHRSVF
jgi:hypothetical protein